METDIPISNLNDFIFCPRSIYFHNLYNNFDESQYHTTYQVKGKNAHKNIDLKKYSSKKSLLTGIDVYSEELGVVGKIDIFDEEKGILIERKKKIKKIYDGYVLQVYAQYFCLLEMGYRVNKIIIYSLSDNKKYPIRIPDENDKNRLRKIICKMKHFSLEKEFSQNPNKCKMCIYKELCDVYKDDEQA